MGGFGVRVPFSSGLLAELLHPPFFFFFSRFPSPPSLIFFFLFFFNYYYFLFRFLFLGVPLHGLFRAAA